MNCWQILGIAPTADIAAIKKAYAALVKQYRPDTHPEQFQQLREAFDIAGQLAANSTQQSAVDPAPATAPEAREPVAAESAAATQEEAEDQEPAASVTARQVLDSIFDRVQASGDAEAIAYFDAMLLSDALLDMGVRQYFELWCMQAATRWREDIEYPGRLFEHMAEHFEWARQRNPHPFIREQWPTFHLRLDRWQRWRNLQVAQQNNIQSAEAKLLTGPVRPFYFWSIILMRANIKRGIDQYLERLGHYNPLALQHEFNTPTVHWWCARRDVFAMPQLGLGMAFFLWLALLFFAMQELSVALHPAVLAAGAAGLGVSAFGFTYGGLFAVDRSWRYAWRTLQPLRNWWLELRIRVLRSPVWQAADRWLLDPAIVFACLLPALWISDTAKLIAWTFFLLNFWFRAIIVGHSLVAFGALYIVMLALVLTRDALGIDENIVKGSVMQALMMGSVCLGHLAFTRLESRLPAGCRRWLASGDINRPFVFVWVCVAISLLMIGVWSGWQHLSH